MAMAAAALLAAPLLLPLTAGLHDRWSGGVPAWVVLGTWGAMIGLAIGLAAWVARAGDELERRMLVNAAAIGGAVTLLLLPPLILTGAHTGLGAGDGPSLAWLAGLAGGVAAYAAQRLRGWGRRA
jgi:hypothetical protein